MRFLIAGLGSIGRRHLRNLIRLGQREIALLRSGQSTLPEQELADFPTYRDLAAALAVRPAAVIVALPTALHLTAAIPAADAGCHLLIEKPVSHSMDGIDELRAAVQRGGGKVLVGFQFRFHPGLREVKRTVESGEIGRPVSARSHWGEYLPGWHPWEAYGTSYAARADLGGGVVLTLCHPFDYLRWIFGEAERAWGCAIRSGELEGDVEDVAEGGMLFRSGVLASVHLDYLQRPKVHSFEVVGTAGVVRWDAEAGTVKVQSTRGEWEKSGPSPRTMEGNEPFLEEMRHFLGVVKGKVEPTCTLEDGIQALELALQMRGQPIRRLGYPEGRPASVAAGGTEPPASMQSESR